MTGLRPLSDAERVDWLRLAGTEHVGPVTSQLMDRFGSACAALAALPPFARRGRRVPARPRSRRRGPQSPGRAAGKGRRSLDRHEGANYPLLLREIADLPSRVVRIDLMAKHAVAVFGARNASASDRRLARDLAQGLAVAGFVVVPQAHHFSRQNRIISGLSLGGRSRGNPSAWDS